MEAGTLRQFLDREEKRREPVMSGFEAVLSFYGVLTTRRGDFRVD